MYIPTPYFKNIPGIGDLEMDHIFLEDNYPILFICKNEEEKLYLCLCRTVVSEQKWLISEISLQTLEDLIYNNVSIYDAFKANNHIYIIHWHKTNQYKYDIIPTANISDFDLPDKTIFLDNKEDLH